MIAAIRDRKKRKRNSSASSFTFTTARLRGGKNGMLDNYKSMGRKGGLGGERRGLTKTLSRRISLAEMHQIEQEHHESSSFSNGGTLYSSLAVLVSSHVYANSFYHIPTGS